MGDGLKRSKRQRGYRDKERRSERERESNWILTSRIVHGHLRTKEQRDAERWRKGQTDREGERQTYRETERETERDVKNWNEETDRETTERETHKERRRK